MSAAGSTQTSRGEARLSTGVAGLDDILSGGLPAGHLYLLEGVPGAGKTTLAMQFLIAGRDAGEPVLYITLSESAQELRYAAASHNWNLDGIELLELSSFENLLKPEQQYTILETADVELGDTMSAIREVIDRVNPKRIVFDSLSELRLLARDPLRFRREILNMKQYFSERQITVLLLDDGSFKTDDQQIRSLAHGIIDVETLTSEFGAERRKLIVTKLRASRFRTGFHDYKINTGGLQVFPRLIASEHRTPVLPGKLLSGIGNLDLLLGGGLDAGTSTMVIGASGTGKTTIAAMYALAVAERGEKSLVFLFDENRGTLIARCRGLKMDIDKGIEDGLINIQQVDPAEMSPGEFTAMIRDAVEDKGVKNVVIDSLSGFVNAMPNERLLMLQLHELLSYLNQLSVTTVLTNVQHGLFGPSATNTTDISYLADTIMLLRYFESAGAVRRAISVLKKRTGTHELTIREYQFGEGGVSVGPVLNEFQGVLTGTPTYFGQSEPLMS